MRHDEKHKNNDFIGELVNVIPIVTNKKYIVNSNGDFTGCLNLTIDNAPTIPSESAMFPEIIFVIVKEITGSST